MANDVVFREVIRDFGERLPQAVEQTSYTVFLCGPAAGQSCRRPSANLRRYVSTQIAKSIKGVTVVWGEHRDFRGKVGRIVLRRFNDLNKEIAFASDHADLVVVFPDSPGSFAELGTFGVNDRICQRMLVIFDRERKDGKGFVVEAVRKAVTSRRAVTRFMNYQDRDSVLRFLLRKVRAGQENLHISRKYDSR